MIKNTVHEYIIAGSMTSCRRVDLWSRTGVSGKDEFVVCWSLLIAARTPHIILTCRMQGSTFNAFVSPLDPRSRPQVSAPAISHFCLQWCNILLLFLYKIYYKYIFIYPTIVFNRKVEPWAMYFSANWFPLDICVFCTSIVYNWKRHCVQIFQLNVLLLFPNTPNKLG